ncbi:MAG TPA: hypothetical protein VK787_02600 [Puia sp.]|jgi:hypothetical protein|nr:hypothetical protein [Puia sp.]
MKKIKLIILVFGLALFTASCHRGNVMIMNDGENELSISYSGEIKFNDDETGIQSITPDGYLHYKKNDRKLNAECDYHGQIKYELSDNGRNIDLNSEDGKKILAIAVRDMINVGFDAKGRLQRIYAKGGNHAILNEIENLKSDYVKAMYMDFLISSDSISQNDLKLVIKKVGSEIGSDFDKGNLLRNIPAKYFQDSVISENWFESVRSIGSDFEKSNALKYAVKQQLSNEQVNNLIDVEESMGSDFEKSNVLKEFIGKSSFNDSYLNKTMDAINNIGSDFEKVNLLQLVMQKEKQTGANFDRMLDATEHVGSEFDKQNLIRELIAPGIPADASFDKLMSVINHVGGDFDKVNLIKEVAGKNIQSEQQWISIINSTAEIGSDFDKSNLLVAIAPTMPKSDNVKTAYTKAAKTINSEQDYGRVMKAMD